MKLYNSFIGIDIGKFNFVVAQHGKNHTREFENNDAGIKQFLSTYRHSLGQALCIIEATGGYELNLLLSLCHHNFAVHRANTRQVKHFIRSFGNSAKTDRLDAKALAHYGDKRHEQLSLYQPSSEKAYELFELVQRRNDLRQMLIAEKNRRQSPKLRRIQFSCDAMVEFIQQQLDGINQDIQTLIKEDEQLKAKNKILMSLPGIGRIVASELLALMPELGQLNRRQAASLAGVAPCARDSGRFSGYRRVAPGRNQVKPMLFLAAMAARCSKSNLKTFYEQLIARGKKKMVALVALMRKIIVIANAKLKELAMSVCYQA